MINPKRGLIVLCTLGILIFSLAGVSAISTNIKDVYAPQETMILQISGNILAPIMPGDIEFLRGHVDIPLNYDVKRLGDNYYLWAVAPAEENNYTLVIHNIATTVSGKSAKVDYSVNFSIAGNATSYYVNPGFVYAVNDFDVNVWLNEDNQKQISTKFTESQDITLKPGQNKIPFSIANAESTGLYTLQIGDYNIPVYVVKETSLSPIESALPNLRFRPKIIQSTLVKGSTQDYPFYIINSGGQDIEDVKFDYDTTLFKIAPDSNVSIASGEIKEFVLSLKNPITNDISGIVIASGENFLINMTVMISATEDTSKAGTPYLQGQYNETENYECSDMNGTVCSPDSEICTGTVVPSAGGDQCCLSLCTAKSTSWTAIIIGIIIIAIVAGAGYYIWKKYKSVKPNKDVLKEFGKQ